MRRLLPVLALALQAALLAAQTAYWDNPRVLVGDGARFPQAVSGGGLVTVVWQEFEANRVWLSLRTSRDLVTWNERRRFAGPYPFQGEQAPLFSVEADDRGRLYVAVASSDRQTTVLYSADGGARFSVATVAAPVTTVGPRLSARADGSVYLFVVYESRNPARSASTTPRSIPPRSSGAGPCPALCCRWRPSRGWCSTFCRPMRPSADGTTSSTSRRTTRSASRPSSSGCG